MHSKLKVGCNGCRDAAPKLSPIAIILKEMYTTVYTRCRGEYGGLNYEYSERVLTNKYGPSIMVEGLMEIMPYIEGIRYEFISRKTKPKK